MNAVEALLASFQPQANATATQAANAALDSIAARPFKVEITVDQVTRDWLTMLAVGLLVGLAVVGRIR